MDLDREQSPDYTSAEDDEPVPSPTGHTAEDAAASATAASAPGPDGVHKARIENLKGTVDTLKGSVTSLKNRVELEDVIACVCSDILRRY